MYNFYLQGKQFSSPPTLRYASEQTRVLEPPKGIVAIRKWCDYSNSLLKIILALGRDRGSNARDKNFCFAYVHTLSARIFVFNFSAIHNFE